MLNIELPDFAKNLSLINLETFIFNLNRQRKCIAYVNLIKDDAIKAFDFIEVEELLSFLRDNFLYDNKGITNERLEVISKKDYVNIIYLVIYGIELVLTDGRVKKNILLSTEKKSSENLKITTKR